MFALSYLVVLLFLCAAILVLETERPRLFLRKACTVVVAIWGGFFALQTLLVYLIFQNRNTLQKFYQIAHSSKIWRFLFVKFLALHHGPAYTLITLSFFLSMIAFTASGLEGSPSRRTQVRKTCLLIAALMTSFLSVEIAFRVLPPSSDGFNISWESKRWFQKYWKPINSLGYRDWDHSHKDISDKKLLFVVGDSFAAGHGIKRIEERFSNVLQDRLGASWVVVNIAQCGWDTGDEIKALQAYPEHPNTIVLSYFINDVEEACTQDGFPIPSNPEPSLITRVFLSESLAADHFYWRIYRLRNAADMQKNYSRYLHDCYDNLQVWDRHSKEMEQVVNYAKTNHAKLVVVIFPMLTDIQRSKPYTNKVAEFFHTNGAEVVDLGTVLAKEEPASLIVSSLDPHPNSFLHRLVAELILPHVKS